jgi:hypothetical protein
MDDTPAKRPWWVFFTTPQRTYLLMTSGIIWIYLGVTALFSTEPTWEPVSLIVVGVLYPVACIPSLVYFRRHKPAEKDSTV